MSKVNDMNKMNKINYTSGIILKRLRTEYLRQSIKIQQNETKQKNENKIQLSNFDCTTPSCTIFY